MVPWPLRSETRLKTIWSRPARWSRSAWPTKSGSFFEHGRHAASGVRVAVGRAHCRPAPSLSRSTPDAAEEPVRRRQPVPAGRGRAGRHGVGRPGARVARQQSLALAFRPRSGMRCLRKPRFNPPKAVFPIVWTALDGALAIGAYRLVAPAVDAPERNRALGLFAANVAMITGWFEAVLRPPQPGRGGRRLGRDRRHRDGLCRRGAAGRQAPPPPPACRSSRGSASPPC